MIENPTEKDKKSLKMIVYMLKNKVNEKIYIGQTVRSFNKRYYPNNWIGCINSNGYLKNSIKKYGQENFQVKILEHSLKTDDELDYWEKFYIKEYNSQYPNGYNFDSGGCKNHKFHAEHKRKISEGVCKEYILRDNAKNELVKIINMSKFCRDNNLDRTSMKDVIKGKIIKYRQWSLPVNIIPKSEITIKPHLKIKIKETYEFRNPDGNKIIITDLRKFCKQNKLTLRHMINVYNGKQNTHKGYTKTDYEIPEFTFFNNLNEKIVIQRGKMRNFCKENNLNEDAFRAIFTGTVKNHKGFKTDTKNEFRPKKYYFLKKEPEGLLYTFESLKEFNQCSISLVLSGYFFHYKCWVKPENELKKLWLKSPQNEVFCVLEDDFKQFCQNNHISRQGLSRVIKGQKHTKGWTLAEPPTDYQI